MREAAEITQGHAEPAATHSIPLPLDVDVRAVRAATGLSRVSSPGGLHSTREPCRIGSRGGVVRIVPPVLI
jgi:hypothetical protein